MERLLVRVLALGRGARLLRLDAVAVARAALFREVTGGSVACFVSPGLVPRAARECCQVAAQRRDIAASRLGTGRPLSWRATASAKYRTSKPMSSAIRRTYRSECA